MPNVRGTKVIMISTIAIALPRLALANCNPEQVADVIIRLCAGPRVVVHHNSYESDPTWTDGESNEFIATVSISDVSICERLPVVIIIGMQVHRIVPRPIFDAISCGVRASPMNANGVDWLARAEIDHDPLRMRIFTFAGELRIKIRITFPE